MSDIIALFVLFVLLQIADGYTTSKLLAMPGTREVNPIMAWLMRKLGQTKALIISKAGVVALIAFTLPSIVWWSLAAVDAVYGYVVWRNWKLLKQKEAEA